MVEERNLELVRSEESPDQLAKSDPDLSKDKLQLRMEATRESISHTVDEIKDTVVNQYESVKESVSKTLDWHEQVKRRPVAWSAGALGAGFVVGYAAAAVVKGPGKISMPSPAEVSDGRVLKNLSGPQSNTRAAAQHAELEEAGPGLIERIKETPAYGRVKSEAGVLGNRFVEEISKKAQDVVLPAAIAWIGSWLEGLSPARKNTGHKLNEN
jgi:hypothetical protein